MGKSFGFQSDRESQRHFRMNRIYRGSVIMNSSVDASAVSVDVAQAVANTQDSNFGLVSVSVTSTQTSQSSTNLGLILGVSIPLGIIRNSYPMQLSSSSY